MRRALLTTAVGLALFAGVVEGLVRALDPTPRVQVVRPEKLAWTWVEGAPLWSHQPLEDAVLTERPDCAGTDATQVVLAGDSTLRVGRYPSEAWDPRATWDERKAALQGNVGLQLEQRLANAGGDWCVRNVAQSGYLPYQYVTALRRAHAEHPVDVAVIEVFKDDTRFTPLDDGLYALDLLDRTDAGLPRPPVPVPHAVHHWLFHHSHAWRYASLALPELVKPPRPEAQAYEDALDWALAEDVRVVFVEFPVLDRPFAEAHGYDWVPPFREQVEQRGMGWVRIADALAGDDVERLRLDRCCHYTPEGHARIADVLAEAVLPVGSAAAVAPGDHAR